MKHSNVCFVYDTVSLDGFPRDNLERFRNAARGLCEFRIAWHPACEGRDQDPDLICHVDADILDVVEHKKDISRGVIPGNFDLKMIRLANDLSNFDKIIRVEYDVISLDPDWAETISALIEVALGCDFAASFVQPYFKGDNWMWWDTLAFPNAESPRPLTEIGVRCFCPVTTFSQGFMKIYAKYLKNGLRGHAEATLATVALDSGASIVNLSAEDIGLTHYPQFTFDKPRNIDRKKSRIIHPVKSIEHFNEVMAIIN